MLLLVLTAHAFVASATHFHRLARTAPEPARAAALGGGEEGQGAPLTNDDSQCLLCRLQRNFASVVQHAVVSFAPLPVEALAQAPLQNVSARATSTLLRSGRAPPHA